MTIFPQKFLETLRNEESNMADYYKMSCHCDSLKREPITKYKNHKLHRKHQRRYFFYYMLGRIFEDEREPKKLNKNFFTAYLHKFLSLADIYFELGRKSFEENKMAEFYKEKCPCSGGYMKYNAKNHYFHRKHELRYAFYLFFVRMIYSTI